MESGKILVSHDKGKYVIKLNGDVRLTLCASLTEYLETIFSSDQVDEVVVDLLDTEGVDSTTLGLLAKLALHCQKHFHIKPTIFCVDEGLVQTLESMGLDDIYIIVDEELSELGHLEPLSKVEGNVDQLKQQILEAHKLLIALKPEKESEFIDLIQCLEDSS